MEILATASDAAEQIDMLVCFGFGHLIALGIVIGCLCAFAFYRGWLL